ncbi:MAG: acyl-CoA dehydrogenase family protein [Myxococcales bacterium]|nr:acyl-CoA dehydrogenase family protein [Myxococcales bacterium]
MIWLEQPTKLGPLVAQARQVGRNVLRPIARKYDRAEHVYPKELDMLAAMLRAVGERGSTAVGLDKRRSDAASARDAREDGARNGANLATVIAFAELCWGDLGLALTLPGQGLGNAAVSAVATPEQLARFGGRWAAMAITEPGAGSDSANIRTTARLDGDEWVIDGEKIFVTAGSRAETVVVWATLDRAQGRAAIKPFVVPRGTPGMEVVRLDEKLGIRASDTATLSFRGCRIPKDNLLGSPEIRARGGFAGVMQTFDNTRPVVAAMALGVGRAALERTEALLRVGPDVGGHPLGGSAVQAALSKMRADLEAARLLTLQAAFLGDNREPNAVQASMAKAKAARVAGAITLRCVELAGSAGYGEDELLEKWARDSKILDIFEGTQQIQLLIIARRLLGKSSRELK